MPSAHRRRRLCVPTARLARLDSIPGLMIAARPTRPVACTTTTTAVTVFALNVSQAIIVWMAFGFLVELTASAMQGQALFWGADAKLDFTLL